MALRLSRFTEVCGCPFQWEMPGPLGFENIHLKEYLLTNAECTSMRVTRDPLVAHLKLIEINRYTSQSIYIYFCFTETSLLLFSHIQTTSGSTTGFCVIALVNIIGIILSHGPLSKSDYRLGRLPVSKISIFIKSQL